MAQTRSAIGDAPLSVSIERMTEHDLLETVEIEEICGLSPWGWDSYHKELGSGQRAIMLVARVEGRQTSLEEGKRNAGFIVSRVVADELHVNNVAVRPQYRRMGIGSRLLNAALAQGATQGSRMAFLEVRASNQAARKLYEGCGFRRVGRRAGYYRDPSEDALIMSVSMTSQP